MQRYEIEAWLGDDHGLADEQIERLLTASDAIGHRYPDPDDADEREAALTVAYRLLVEDPDSVVAELAGVLTAARLAECRALAGLRQAVVDLIDPAPRRGHHDDSVRSQSGFAARAGLDRAGVIRWLRER
jgi:hypothetical protein